MSSESNRSKDIHSNSPGSATMRTFKSRRAAQDFVSDVRSDRHGKWHYCSGPYMSNGVFRVDVDYYFHAPTNHTN